MRTSAVACGLLLLGAGLALAGGPPEPVWRELEPGLEVGRFASPSRRPTPDGDLTVLRIDPGRFALKLITTAADDPVPGRDVVDWCAEHDLLAAVNAGMYQANRRTHVGYCKVEGRVVNPIRVDAEVAHYARVALDQMLALPGPTHKD